MTRDAAATGFLAADGRQLELWPGMPAGRCPLCRTSEPAPSACASCALRAARVTEARLSWSEERALLTAERGRVGAERAARERAAEETAARWRALGRPVRVALVGCGAAKRDGRFPARDLYTGSLFRETLRHAEATADDVLIVSGLHHLIEPDQEIGTYDRDLAAMRTVERAAWGLRVVGLLAARYPGQDVELTLYPGATYVCRGQRGSVEI